MSQRRDLPPQPYIEGNEIAVEDNGSVSDAKADRFSRRASQLQAEREAILAQEDEESDALREKLREAGWTIDDNDETAESANVKAIHSDWESTVGDESETAQGAIDFLSFAPRSRSRKGRRKRRLDVEEGRSLKRQSKDRLDDLLSILHLALVSLRVPIVWNDLCM